jgi:anti-sigma B factor antagonist
MRAFGRIGCTFDVKHLRDATEPRTLAFSPSFRGLKMLGTCRALGDIDRATASTFDVELRDSIDSSADELVRVDCSGVTFMDSAGYRVLVGATAYAVRRGHTLVLSNMSSSCAMLIRLCDPEHELRIEP